MKNNFDVINGNLLDEDFSNFRLLGIGKETEGQKRIRAKFKKAVSDAGKNIKGTFKDAGKNIKETTKDIVQNKNLKKGLKATFLTYNPVVAVPRSSALLSFRVNLFGISSRLYPAFLSDEELIKYNFDVENAKNARVAWERVANFWEDKIGGDRNKLKEAITGAWNKPVFKTKKSKARKERTSTFYGDEGYSNAGGADDAVIASYITAGLGVVSGVIGIIAQSRAKKNPFKEGSSESQSYENQIANENPPVVNAQELAKIIDAVKSDRDKGLPLDNTGVDSTDIDNNDSSDDKILGMPKGLAIGLGIAILAVGGFIVYKKFIAKK